MSPTYWISYIGQFLYVFNDFWSSVPISFCSRGWWEEVRKREKKSLSESAYMLKFWVHSKWSSLICSIYDVLVSFSTTHTTPSFSNLLYCQILPLFTSLPFSVDILFFWFGEKNQQMWSLYWMKGAPEICVNCFLVLSEACRHWSVVGHSNGDA